MKKSYFLSSEFCGKIRYSSFVVVCFILFGMVLFTNQQALAQGGGLQDELKEEEIIWRLKEKYADVLGVERDSLSQISLYRMVDKWSDFARLNPGKITQQQEGIFAQYIYYLVYNTKIPSQVNLIYSDKKTYLFKNQEFLRTGDLLFLGKKGLKPDRVAVYLQNNMLVFPGDGEDLIFKSLLEIQQKYAITAAKIVKDEEKSMP